MLRIVHVEGSLAGRATLHALGRLQFLQALSLRRSDNVGLDDIEEVVKVGLPVVRADWLLRFENKGRGWGGGGLAFSSEAGI